ncbi:hypothetical protein ACO0RG_004340 [Hanseniaspora osmophila]
MISSTCWVPKGFAKEFPESYELNDEEMERINKMAEQMNLNESENFKPLTKKDITQDQESEEFKYADDEDLKKFNLDKYDDDEEDDNDEITEASNYQQADANFDGSILPGTTQIEQDGQHYLELPNVKDNNNADSDHEEDDIILQEEEKQDLQIYKTDNLVLATRTDMEGDLSYLDVYVYDDGDDNQEYARESSLYMHHDVMLPAFPLCVEWINYKPNPNSEEIANNSDNLGNFAAIGTFDPNIEIWNLDCVEKTFPDAILQGHKDAILSLSHNEIHRNVLCSTSADSTVKIWDLNNTSKCVETFKKIHGKSKVSCSQWNNFELLTAGYDSRIALTDVREGAKSSRYWKISSNEELETIKFSADKTHVLTGTDNGNVYCFDTRNPNSSPVWTLKAHDAGLSCLNINQTIDNMFVTAAMGEKVVKIWKYENNRPKLVTTRDFGIGNILTTSFAPDFEVSGNLVVGGVSGGLQLWDTFTNGSVRKQFSKEFTNIFTNNASDSPINRFPRFSSKYKNNSAPKEVVFAAEKAEDMNEDDDDAEEIESDDE